MLEKEKKDVFTIFRIFLRLRGLFLVTSILPFIITISVLPFIPKKYESVGMILLPRYVNPLVFSEETFHTKLSLRLEESHKNTFFSYRITRDDQYLASLLRIHGVSTSPENAQRVTEATIDLIIQQETAAISKNNTLLIGEVEGLKQKITQLQSSIEDMNKKQIGLLAPVLAAKITQESYLEEKLALKKNELAQKLNFEIVSPASLPKENSQQKRIAISLSIFLGLILGSLVVLGVDIFKGK